MDRLYPLVYEQLRRMAHRRMQAERPGHTLGTTGLVHETYLKLVDQTRVEWHDRAQFFALAARAMRRVLVDYARRYAALQRGGGLKRVPLAEDVPRSPNRGTLFWHWTRLWNVSRLLNRSARPGRGMPLFRRHDRGGNSGGARGNGADGTAGLGKGAGLAVPRARREVATRQRHLHGCHTASGLGGCRRDS